MITIGNESSANCIVRFYGEGSSLIEEDFPKVSAVFQGKYLQSRVLTDGDGKVWILIGMGKPEEVTILQVKELLAKAAKEVKCCEISEAVIDISEFLKICGIQCVEKCVESIRLGLAEGLTYKKDAKAGEHKIFLAGIPEDQLAQAQELQREGEILGEAVTFTRNLVNMPGNKLRPIDLAKEIEEHVKDCEIEYVLYDYDKLQEMGMGALNAVGGSSEFPPCMCVLRYKGDPQSKEITGLVGKGVTSDTGGYCLKSRDSLIGMHGDMAGGAVTASVIRALAKSHARVNVTCIIPICENRLTAGSLLPGDVITSYSGQTIEILNTDAEGRLILADGVSYAVMEEKVTSVLDIATLTGAMANALGNHVTGVISDSDRIWSELEAASAGTGEYFCRLPFYRENEKMLESEIADIKNMGESFCGAITAGLFIRHFANQVPWIHLDIAGTAHVGRPLYEFQAKGATGATIDTIYRWLRG